MYDKDTFEVFDSFSLRFSEKTWNFACKIHNFNEGNVKKINCKIFGNLLHIGYQKGIKKRGLTQNVCLEERGTLEKGLDRASLRCNGMI